MSRDEPIRVGDIVERIDKPELDPRRVAHVGGEMLRLDIFGKPTPPIPAHLYRVVRRADGTRPLTD